MHIEVWKLMLDDDDSRPMLYGSPPIGFRRVGRFEEPDLAELDRLSALTRRDLVLEVIRYGTRASAPIDTHHVVSRVRMIESRSFFPDDDARAAWCSIAALLASMVRDGLVERWFNGSHDHRKHPRWRVVER